MHAEMWRSENYSFFQFASYKIGDAPCVRILVMREINA
jgi:hypothetical protein